MKDKEKQIMELMKDKEFVKLVRLIDNTRPFYVETIALRVYEKYQPKLPEDSVVLTKEEINDIKVNYFNYGAEQGYEKGRLLGSKETAEYFIKEYGYLLSQRAKDELTKQYGVEIKE